MPTRFVSRPSRSRPLEPSAASGSTLPRDSGALAEVHLPWRIEMVPIRQLKPAARNARTHSNLQIRQLAELMARFGVTTPVIADMHGSIVAGHARVEAATLIGLKHLPVIRLEQLSDTELRAYTLADNRIALSAGWDREKLATELRELEVLLPKIDLDLGITGFNPAEIDALVVDFGEPTGEGPEAIPELDGSAVVAQPGDLFALGRHRLLCGDATDRKAYARLMQGAIATMSFLDPPYNVKIDGHVSGLGTVTHREFLCASGEMTPRQFERFLYRLPTPVRCSQHRWCDPFRLY